MYIRNSPGKIDRGPILYKKTRPVYMTNRACVLKDTLIILFSVFQRRRDKIAEERMGFRGT